MIAAAIAGIVALGACSHTKKSSTATTTTSTTEVTISIPTIPLETTTTTTTIAAATTTTSTSTTVAATTTTTTTTGTATVAMCAGSNLALTAKTDRSSYTATENVNVTVSFTNRSSTLCQISRVAAVNILNPAGAVVHQQQYGDSFEGTSGQIKPDQTFTLTFGWNQTGCSTAVTVRCPVGGSYVAVASLGELSTRVTFALD